MSIVSRTPPPEPGLDPTATRLEEGYVPIDDSESGDGKGWLSPINRRRLANFKANRRGFWSLVLFLAIFTLTLFAELLANDKPLMIRHGQGLYFPVLFAYSEREFGGTLPVEADYQSLELRERITRSGGWVVDPPIPFDYQTIDLYLPQPAPAPPSSRHWFGTDDSGRDTLARLIYGFRLSVLFGLALTAVSSAIGITAGAMQGYFGGRVDLIFQRIIEIWQGLPTLFILIILASIVESNVYWILLILVLFNWLFLVGVVRAEVLRGRQLEYVKAARAIGVPELTIMFKHLLPNALVAAMTFLPFMLTGAITALTGLDFLGFGLPPESASLGRLLNQGKANLHAPWLGLTAVATLSIMLVLLIFVGEAIRDAFNPRKYLATGAAP